jgi:hypothetical protein
VYISDKKYINGYLENIYNNWGHFWFLNVNYISKIKYRAKQNVNQGGAFASDQAHKLELLGISA